MIFHVNYSNIKLTDAGTKLKGNSLMIQHTTSKKHSSFPRYDIAKHIDGIKVILSEVCTLTYCLFVV